MCSAIVNQADNKRWVELDTADGMDNFSSQVLVISSGLLFFFLVTVLVVSINNAG